MTFRFASFIAVYFFTSTLCADDPVVDLAKWLEQDFGKRAKLAEQSFADASLTRDQADKASELLLKDFQERIKKERQQQWKDREIKLGNHSMKFAFRVFGEKPKTGRSLYISMHGGGGAPARVNDQQWQNQIRLYEPKEGVYLAPRAPTNTWNLWHQSHIDEFFEWIIESAIVFEGVDPNKVYIMGYSAGGDGVYQLAPRMADQLAAAAMMAGHPNDASPLGLRNIGFTLHMGGKDSAYNRNGIAREWKKKLAELEKNDPGAYKHEVVIHEQYGHWMQRDDRVAVPWMAKFTREANPQKIVWRQASTTHDRFYWLAADKEHRKNGSLIVAERDGQTFAISKMENLNKVTLRLNDTLVDLNKEVVVKTPDGEKKTSKATRKISTIFKCLSERVDPSAIYSAELTVPFSK